MANCCAFQGCLTCLMFVAAVFIGIGTYTLVIIDGIDAHPLFVCDFNVAKKPDSQSFFLVLTFVDYNVQCKPAAQLDNSTFPAVGIAVRYPADPLLINYKTPSQIDTWNDNVFGQIIPTIRADLTNRKGYADHPDRSTFIIITAIASASMAFFVIVCWLVSCPCGSCKNLKFDICCCDREDCCTCGCCRGCCGGIGGGGGGGGTGAAAAEESAALVGSAAA